MSRAYPARVGVNEWEILIAKLMTFDPLLVRPDPSFHPDGLSALEMKIGSASFEIRPERISNPVSRGLRGTSVAKKNRYRADITCSWPSSRFSPLRAAQQIAMIERVTKVALFAEHLFSDRIYTENGEILVR